jgi:glycosyltransferase involved in cell wall biosynthesis
VCELNIVIPFLNEESSLPELLARISEQTDLPEQRELIFVSDGSTDGSVSIITQAIEKDRRIKLIQLSRNFGHQAAVSAGLDHARGNYVAVMDADLQDEPHVLADMLERARREGWDVVYAVRTSRKGSWLKKLCYGLFYRLYSLLSETPVNMDSGDFCVMSRRCLENLREMPEQVRFHRGLRSWVGLRQVGHPAERPERFAGEAQYTWRDLLKLGLSGLTSFSIRPLRLASLLGCCLCATSVLAVVVYIAYALVYDVPSYVPGFTTLVSLLLFLNGVLMVQLGIIGEYMGCLFLEVKRRPSYLVQSRFNIKPAEDDSSESVPKTENQSPDVGQDQ